MTKKEAAQILAILKAAYPNSYKNMSIEEANGTATVWSIHFSNIPVQVVYIAVNKWISKNPFPPAINEVRREIEFLYYEVLEILKTDEGYNTLTAEQRETYKMILKVSERLRGVTSTPEIKIEELVDTGNRLFLNEGKGEAQ